LGRTSPLNLRIHPNPPSSHLLVPPSSIH
jgi:hypothetical protein